MKPLHVIQVQAAYVAGYKKCLEDAGKLKPYISQAQAYAKYGRVVVDRWVNEGLITVIKDGANNCRCRINREQIELIAETSNRNSWYEHNEDKI